MCCFQSSFSLLHIVRFYLSAFLGEQAGLWLVKLSSAVQKTWLIADN